eukprot:CAMPEP_0196806400 /NCGR_PEP_ID=MMETSP1362-20130617/6292_1 /TAXON_ID=163516 /ORGANISM="Leptocylindrus danicus, Strain CCMP1856" /LENGTH=439 /DNA_ID=CAMNT_0042179859 /DNA_START=68 /DNA_END=1384 /DNA_ORIENTATION=+
MPASISGRSLVALLLLAPPADCSLGVYAFCTLTSTRLTRESCINSRITFLQAKKVKKKTKKKAAPARGSGGFGSPAAQASPKPSGDYAIFPPLEQSVKDTLIPAPASVATEAGDLSEEMYARIGHVHGFPRFNYLSGLPVEVEEETAEEESPLSASVSFNELIGSTSSSSAVDSMSDLLSPSKGSSDIFATLDDVVGGGGSAPEVNGFSATATPPATVDVSKLPPFDKFRVLHIDPLVIAVDEFFTREECDRYIAMSDPTAGNKDGDAVMTRSMTVGKDAAAKSQRTSTTWFHHYKNVPELMAKSSRLFGLDDIGVFEEPQTVRYQPNQKFTWHLDALAPGSENISKGGQRTATLLVYLTDLGPEDGGATTFRDLGPAEGEPLKVQPKKGSALLFFPAAGGIPNTPFDIRTLHAGEVVSADCKSDKWIAQLWLREDTYE